MEEEEQEYMRRRSLHKMSSVLRMLQWNTLADGLAQHGDFAKVDSNILEWASRAPVLLEEIRKTEAHVICLQEVNHFDDFFIPHLEEYGYAGVFHGKPFSPALKYGCARDGCALFFRQSRLQLLVKEVFLYEFPNGVSHNQGAIICHFEDSEAKKDVIIATTHFKASTGHQNETLRLMQAEQLLKRLSIVAGSNEFPIIICGDLNTLPNSEVCKLFREHSLQFQSIYALTCNCNTSHGLENSLIQSLCEDVSDGGEDFEPQFTTWKFRSTGVDQRTIDYIWLSKQDAMVPYRRWQLPDVLKIGDTGLPSSTIPSDHLPLLCELIWKA
ncbi:hypothetical protein O6H91_04G146300 [Diphasiastrum complanatum]|uniref:Uncharacterized protein n=1 Tax=Diphasiastrum complanatum TaxID=34168 RepID=A0ACC2E2S7_DIPCM|nr:hypothetical protein O6H91_04G146300 [Diphasiastrum complanatum]